MFASQLEQICRQVTLVSQNFLAYVAKVLVKTLDAWIRAPQEA